MKRRRLGQHYLVDQDVIQRIVEFAGIQPSDRVVEIGTGKGALTRELAGKGASLTGYEVDSQNFGATVEVVRDLAKVVLADAFEQEVEFDVLVSSLPYSESATFVKWLSGKKFDRAVVLLQTDFVEKVMAPPGGRDYRGVSALAQIAFTMKVLSKVSRKSFAPQPRVDSVIVSFLPRLRVSAAEASNIIKLFSLRRRQVATALARLGFGERGSYGSRRVNSLFPEEVHEICRPRSSP
jgi:16S rRNA (adenine1518-N6/adenine1519-N6)-dimethyltransferase